MYNIRARPKDQSSDEEGNEREHREEKISSSIQSDEQNGSDQQSAFNEMNIDQKQTDDENNDVSTVHSDGNQNDQKPVDFSMFKSKGNECGGNEQEKGAVFHCAALQRLGAALKAYSAMNRKHEALYNGNDDEMEPDIPSFSEFVGSEYRVQFLEDFNHFMAEHQYFAEEIKEEMMKRYGLKQCDAMNCKLTTRHFGGRRVQSVSRKKKEDIRSTFYRQKFDSLHFHLFHLEESGYRYRSKAQRVDGGNAPKGLSTKTAEEEDERKAIDRELEEAVSTINANKKKCDFGRFQGGGPNKFTLSVSGIDSTCFVVTFYLLSFTVSSPYSAKTWMDRMAEYVQSQGVPVDVIERAAVWLQREGFDSDATKLDVNEDTVKNKECSMSTHIANEALYKAITDFVRDTAGSFTLNMC